MTAGVWFVHISELFLLLEYHGGYWMTRFYYGGLSVGEQVGKLLEDCANIEGRR
jgi:hypothetical protein